MTLTLKDRVVEILSDDKRHTVANIVDILMASEPYRNHDRKGLMSNVTSILNTLKMWNAVQKNWTYATDSYRKVYVWKLVSV